MTKRFDGLSQSQEFTLGQIAMGIAWGHHPRTLASLLRRGLIEERTVELSVGAFGALTIRTYELPLAEHIRWYQWCADHRSDEEMTLEMTQKASGK